MNNIEKLGFDNWFWSSIPSGKDKADLSKTDFNIARVISVNKNSFVVSNGVWWTSRSYRDVSGNFCHGATVATKEVYEY
jgi:hypothetical protein